MTAERLRVMPYVNARREQLQNALGVTVPARQRAELIVDHETIVGAWWLCENGQVSLQCEPALRTLLTERICREAGHLGFSHILLDAEKLVASGDPRPEHTSHYCEENAARFVLADGAGALVFICSAARACPFSFQRGSLLEEQPLLWDYHVVAAEPGLIFDLDSTLGFPVPIETYLAATFQYLPHFGKDNRPYFRVLSKEQTGAFSSDRSHMLAADGSYLAPIPPWPPLGEGSNLEALIGDEPGLGVVCQMGELASAIGRAGSFSS